MNCKTFNSLRPRQDGRHFPDDIFECIFLYENVCLSIIISLKFVLQGPINNIPALVQIMAWRRPGDKPLSEPMMVSLLTHMCVTRSQWVNNHWCICSLAHICVTTVVISIPLAPPHHCTLFWKFAESKLKCFLFSSSALIPLLDHCQITLDVHFHVKVMHWF